MFSESSRLSCTGPTEVLQVTIACPGTSLFPCPVMGTRPCLVPAALRWLSPRCSGIYRTEPAV